MLWERYMDLGSLLPGQTLLEEGLAVSPEASGAYLAAVGDTSALYREQGLVPPMALVALALAATMRSLDIPAGTVHTGQEVAFSKLVTVGAPLRCSATVDQNTVRRGLRFLRVLMHVTNEGETVVQALTSLAIAEGDKA